MTDAMQARMREKRSARLRRAARELHGRDMPLGVAVAPHVQAMRELGEGIEQEQTRDALLRMGMVV